MSEFYIGLMSGTSVDSIDAVLVDLTTNTPLLIASLSQHWPENIRQAIFASRQLDDNRLGELEQLDQDTADIFAVACNQLLQQAELSKQDIKAIGSHGQTIRHRPDADKPFSLQIGNARRISSQTGIRVVSDFRRADIKAGGQGAPLVPAFHQHVFQHAELNRVVVNIGGIANITVLPSSKSQQADNSCIIGFDTGPGNNLMDAWINRHRQQAFDENGKLSACGKTRAGLLARLLMDTYFQRPPPKSTGFEYFNLDWLQTYLEAEKIKLPLAEDETVAEIQSTLCDLTAVSIIKAINLTAPDTDEIYICGGGVHNDELMRRLSVLGKRPVLSTKMLGVHPDWVEAMTFAWLAQQNLRQQAGNIPSVTGASEAVILGTVTEAG